MVTGLRREMVKRRIKVTVVMVLGLINSIWYYIGNGNGKKYRLIAR
jgi:hypothetical protein